MELHSLKMKEEKDQEQQTNLKAQSQVMLKEQAVVLDLVRAPKHLRIASSASSASKEWTISGKSTLVIVFLIQWRRISLTSS